MTSFSGVQFDPQVETISEFFERFHVQFSDQLSENATDMKRSNILMKTLPVNIITDLQRGLKPKKLSEASFAEIEGKLKAQFEIKKSIIGASVKFISRKQHPGETIEQYAQTLNNLADSCEYKHCCRSRYLRDIFVAGLNSTKIISALLHHECDKMEFNTVVEKAKLLQTFTNDVENIKHEDRCHVVRREEASSRGKVVPRNYVCIRCGTKENHFANECFALKLKCNNCSRIGHLAKCCKAKKKVNALTHEYDSSECVNMKTAHSTHGIAPSLTSTYTSRPETFTRLPPAASANQEEEPFGASGPANQRSDASSHPQMGRNSIYGVQSADLLHTPADMRNRMFKCEDKFNDFFSINATVFPIKYQPTIVSAYINSMSVNFEVDSGSHVSTISYNDAIRCRCNIDVCSTKVLGYSGNQVKTLGECFAEFSFNNNTFIHKFLIVESHRVNLIGRDICSLLNCSFSIPDKLEINNIYDKILGKFKDYLSPNFISCVTEKVELTVIEKDVKPNFVRARPVPIKLKGKVKNEIEKLVKDGKLSKVFNSEWASPCVHAIKKDGNIRLCGDFSRTINPNLSIVNAKLISVDEVISQIGDAKIFSKIDLSQAFLQLPLSENSKEYTTINTSEGLFRWNYLPFGLKSSPGLFQGFMNKMLNGINHIIVYQDDVLIMTPNLEIHHDILYKVLESLKNAGIKLNVEKCEFYVDHVTYLGHIFSKNGVKPDHRKISAILDAPAPSNLKQLQSFIGLCNFYARFIQNFSELMHPFYQLLRKNVKFTWGKDQETAFYRIKFNFKSNRVLSMFDSNYETMIECDSSGYGVGAVLFQRKNEYSEWKPVQFASRSLNPAEMNYSNIEREGLSVIFGVEKFRKYLLGSFFIIRNDQKPLRKLFAHNSGVPNSGSARLQRWYLRLSQYNYRFEYSKGENNITSDCLSRLPLPETVTDSEPYELIFAINELNSMPVSFEQIKNHTLNDKNLQNLKNYIKFGFPAIRIDKKLEIYRKCSDRLSILKECIMFDNRIVIPEALREIVLKQFHEDHPGIVAMKSSVRSLIWYPGIDNDVERLVKSCTICQNNRSKPSQKCHIEWPQPKRPWQRIHIDHFFITIIFFYLS